MSKSWSVTAHSFTQILRFLWLAMPWLAGNALGQSFAAGDRSTIVGTIAAWMVWATAMIALLAVVPVALTAARITIPAAALGAAWAGFDSGWTGPSIVGLAAGLAAMSLIWSAPVADDFVNGTAYGDEQRFSLRAPGVLVLGIVQAVSTLTTVGVLAGPFALLQGRVAVGVALCVIGVAIAAAGARSLHTLSTRFVVFVPNGVTLVDALAVSDSVLFERGATLAFGPAAADTEALDLSMRALGVPLQMTMREPVPVTLRTGRRAATVVESARILVAPARPGAVLNEAVARNFGIVQHD